MKRRSLAVIRVFSSPLDRRRGRVRAGGAEWPCALGRAGVCRLKREGDGATPAGRFRVLSGFWRADRRGRPATSLPMRPIRPMDAWCDDVRSPRYNRLIRAPAGSLEESLWRADGLYDVVLDLSYNRAPVIRGRGSAVFLHLGRPGLTPTAGCVALPASRIDRLLLRIGPRTAIVIR